MDEALIYSGLQIVNDTIDVRTQPQTFTGDVTGKAGPVPGAILVATEGTDVDLSSLTTPAYGRIKNLDPTNFVEWGIWDGVEFIPMFEILAGEFYVFRVSRNLGESFATGTGTTDTGNTMRLKADTADCWVEVLVFEN